MSSPAPVAPDLPTAPFYTFGKIGAYVTKLLALISGLNVTVARLWAENRRLSDELLRLKGEKEHPKFKGSKLVERTEKGLTQPEGAPGEPVGAPTEPAPLRQPKRAKTDELVIHELRYVELEQSMPAGSVRVGYEYFTVQDLVIELRNTLICRERWRAPDGTVVVAELPPEYAGCHFGPSLRCFALSQHHDCNVSQPHLLEQLREYGVVLSSGHLNNLLSHGIESFAQESIEVLKAGLLHSPAITVDDSSARHMGCNAVVTAISSEAFAWYGTTGSKSRSNFLELLCAGEPGYVIDARALHYMAERGMPPPLVLKLRRAFGSFSLAELCDKLDALGILGQEARRIATEGALWGALKDKLHPEMAIVSDGAQQFVLELQNHGLCWVHSERLVHKLLAGSKEERSAQQQVRDDIWSLYYRLRAYKASPNPATIPGLKDEFDRVFTRKTCFTELNAQLARLHAHKDELLLVLRRPDVPLHTNQSETDIREFVRRRVISGGTRGERGRRRRDVFATLKNTSRKLGVSFIAYLTDRICGNGGIAPLADLIKTRMAPRPA